MLCELQLCSIQCFNLLLTIDTRNNIIKCVSNKSVLYQSLLPTLSQNAMILLLNTSSTQIQCPLNYNVHKHITMSNHILKYVTIINTGKTNSNQNNTAYFRNKIEMWPKSWEQLLLQCFHFQS